MPPRTEPWSSDAEIVERVLSGDREAFELLYEETDRRDVERGALRQYRRAGSHRTEEYEEDEQHQDEMQHLADAIDRPPDPAKDPQE